jgi:Spy/CpxP family protein refolding chaperone
MKTKLLNFLVLIIIGTGVVSAQLPERFERRNNPNPEQNFRTGPGERVNEFLELSTEQKEAVKKIWLESAKALKPIKDELRELKAKHQTLTTQSKPDMDAINKSIEKIGSVKVQIAKIQAKRQQEFRALLTEEQLLKLDNHKGRMKDTPVNFRHRGNRRI